MTIKCPFCNKTQTQKPSKTWKYGNSIDVKRYECPCGKSFNHYKSPKTEWTIPKNQGKKTIKQ